MASLTLTAFATLVLLLHCVAQMDDPSCSSEECTSSPDDAQSLLLVRNQVTEGDSDLEDGTEQLQSASRRSAVTILQRQSLSLSRQLLLAAKVMPENSVTKSFLESFRICGQCNSFQRFGEANDGGYLMCMDGLQPGKVTAAYSLGVEQHDQWSQDVADYLKIPVNQFDCTVNTGSNCQSCKFFKKCIVSADGQHPVSNHESEGWSLAQALSETSQGSAADGSLLMKMDIESSEWPIYASESPEVLKKFGELIVEFHNLQDESRHAEYLQGMQHILAAGFKVAHLHGNNYQDMYQTSAVQDAASIPKVLEVTFIHGDSRPTGCSADQIYEGLDAPNNPGTPELQMAHLS